MTKTFEHSTVEPTIPNFLTSERNKEHVQKEIKNQFIYGEKYIPIHLLEPEKFGTKTIASVLWHSDNKEWMKISSRKKIRKIVQ